LQLCASSFPACTLSYSHCSRDERALRASRIALLASMSLLARRAFSLACNGGSSARKPFSLKGKARRTHAQGSHLGAQGLEVGKRGESARAPPTWLRLTSSLSSFRQFSNPSSLRRIAFPVRTTMTHSPLPLRIAAAITLAASAPFCHTHASDAL